ncbi:sensor histidine kinase [Zavarzinia sp. CC-PAN008]|uniref:sensor histidine kinase n=1 Tax=Zavarzinia sp. CC-PAN008 TaxID=3243332 RepID=UPI003F748AA3
MTALPGAPAAAAPDPAGPAPGPPIGRFRRVLRSLWFRITLLLVVFILVPVVLYGVFERAEGSRRELLQNTLREMGTILAAAIQPLTQRGDGAPYPSLQTDLARYQTEAVSIKLLFRPADLQGSAGSGFFYVAAAPAIPPEDLAAERALLIESGVLNRMGESCSRSISLSMRVTRGDSSELVTSITPVRTDAGCWGVVLAQNGQRVAGLEQPFWQSYEVRIAAVTYGLLALISLGVLFELYRSLQRFGRQARAVQRREPGVQFVSDNAMPELDGVAREFDRMVAQLRASADTLRQTAEETAHAFKTPLAIIQQALEPVRRRAVGDERLTRALTAIGASLQRLDALVASTRQLERANAAVLDPPREQIALSEQVERIVASYGGEGEVAVAGQIAPGLKIRGGGELIEIVMENLIDNAISFSPAEAQVDVVLARDGAQAVLQVMDRGPGVAPEKLERIFERYYSERPGMVPTAQPGTTHQGMGLWLVRRNVEAMGGTVAATPRDGGGLVISVRLPLAG